MSGATDIECELDDECPDCNGTGACVGCGGKGCESCYGNGRCLACSPDPDDAA